MCQFPARERRLKHVAGTVCKRAGGVAHEAREPGGRSTHGSLIAAQMQRTRDEPTLDALVEQTFQLAGDDRLDRRLGETQRHGLGRVTRSDRLPCIIFVGLDVLTYGLGKRRRTAAEHRRQPHASRAETRRISKTTRRSASANERRQRRERPGRTVNEPGRTPRAFEIGAGVSRRRGLLPGRKISRVLGELIRPYELADRLTRAAYVAERTVRALTKTSHERVGRGWRRRRSRDWRIRGQELRKIR